MKTGDLIFQKSEQRNVQERTDVDSLCATLSPGTKISQKFLTGAFRINHPQDIAFQYCCKQLQVPKWVRQREIRKIV